MADFVNLAATAKRLIEANGRLVTLIRKSRTPAVAGEPWRGPDLAAPDPVDGLGPVRVAFVPATGGGFGKMLFDSDETLRVRIDQVGLLAADSVLALVPARTLEQVEQSDTLRDGAKVYKIKSVGHLKPADTSLIFVLGLSL